MANMSYCRFQNTVQDLRDCIDHIGDGDIDDVWESNARRQLIKLCKEVAEDYDLDDFPFKTKEKEEE